MPWRTLARIAAGGVACAFLVLLGGWGIGRLVLGADDNQARERVEAEVRATFDTMSRALRDMAHGSGGYRDVRAAATATTPQLIAC